MVNSAKATLAKFFRWVKVVSGFFELLVAENMGR